MSVTEGDILEMEEAIKELESGLVYLENRLRTNPDGRARDLAEGVKSLIGYLKDTARNLRLPPGTDESEIDWELPDRLARARIDAKALTGAVESMKNNQGISSN